MSKKGVGGVANAAHKIKEQAQFAQAHKECVSGHYFVKGWCLACPAVSRKPYERQPIVWHMLCWYAFLSICMTLGQVSRCIRAALVPGLCTGAVPRHGHNDNVQLLPERIHPEPPGAKVVRFPPSHIRYHQQILHCIFFFFFCCSGSRSIGGAGTEWRGE